MSVRDGQMNTQERQLIATELQEEIAFLEAKLHDLQHQNRKEENTKLIGACFRFSDSYGSGKRWWKYFRVVGLDEDGETKAVTFAHTSMDRFELSTESWRFHTGYQRITLKKFNQEFVKFSNSIIERGLR